MNGRALPYKEGESIVFVPAGRQALHAVGRVRGVGPYRCGNASLLWWSGGRLDFWRDQIDCACGIRGVDRQTMDIEAHDSFVYLRRHMPLVVSNRTENSTWRGARVGACISRLS